MTPDVWQRVKNLVGDALEQPEAERAAFINESGEATTVRREAKSMLVESIDRLEACANSLVATTDDESDLVAGRRIGAYRIVRQLGRGGMGAVFLAERADGAFRKQVAIKILKRGTDTDEVLRRFRGERQILARLNHPNIAGLLDGGETDDGLPYFVMEYVDGKRITTYAQENQLPVPKRLSLFRVVCAAVGHAHQNLVIHRDLKPNNVLITTEGEVKLLDFGIAKLVDELTTDVTVTLHRRMTPEYASPEQIKGEPITTVSDIYSLGVLLYELLTGERPYKLKTRSQLDISQAVCEQEPERPSTAIAKRDGSSKPETANPKQLRGDLDNIVLKALRKEPARRYVSVDQFSADIRRYLEGLPVRARKDTPGYRASKFIRRHKITVTVTAALALVLIVGSITTAWQAHQARMEKARAERRLSEDRKIAHSLMLELHNSIKDLPGAMSARQLIMQRAVEYLDGLVREMGNDLSLVSELAVAYEQIGNVTFDVGQSLQAHQKAVALNETLVRADPKNVIYREQLAESYGSLSDVSKIVGDSAQAIAAARKSVAITQTLAASPATSRDRQTALDAQLSLGIALLDAGQDEQALEVDIQAVQVQEKIVAAYPSDKETCYLLARAYGEISDAYRAHDDAATALEYAHKQLDLTKRFDDPQSSNVRNRRYLWSAYFHLGKCLAATGDADRAFDADVKAVAMMEELANLDPNDRGHRRWLALTYLAIGEVSVSRGESDRALDYCKKAISSDESLLASDPKRTEVRRDLARMYESAGNLLFSISQPTAALERFKKAETLAGDSVARDPQNLRVKTLLAAIYSDEARLYLKMSERSQPGKRQSRLQSARDSYTKSLELWQRVKEKRRLSSSEASTIDRLAREASRCVTELEGIAAGSFGRR